MANFMEDRSFDPEHDAEFITVTSPDGTLLSLNMAESIAHMDAWWGSLSFSQKLDLYDVASSWPPDNVCKFCGCTDSCACPEGCGWANDDCDVCDSPECLAKLELETPQFPPLNDKKEAV